jgi:hypothetical protein
MVEFRISTPATVIEVTRAASTPPANAAGVDVVTLKAEIVGVNPFAATPIGPDRVIVAFTTDAM